MLDFECACGAKYRLKDELAGKSVRCPKCSKVSTVAGGGLGIVLKAPPSAPPKDPYQTDPKMPLPAAPQAQNPPSAPIPQPAASIQPPPQPPTPHQPIAAA
ncbi:MAG: hypothetical protein WC943_14390, partial [Elusimicrobiota bacterium]